MTHWYNEYIFGEQWKMHFDINAVTLISQHTLKNEVNYHQRSVRFILSSENDYKL